jgi:hypothetical protein
MAHFAEIDENNTVVRVLVVPDEQEHRGQDFLADDLGLGGRWIQTSYNSRIRKNYAGIGFTFDENRDAFIAPKPYESWQLDESTCVWFAPIERPNDGKLYDWNEEALSWNEIVIEGN